MTLNFLGLSYSKPAATMETSELQVSGTYRGRQISFSSAAPRNLDSATALRYRGVMYLR
ncbi:MAG: DUF4278 domain-containing protein [Synechococcales bacterium]|nr:DUF4278 domain-containing protein [Synechococcales bacterium]